MSIKTKKTKKKNHKKYQHDKAEIQAIDQNIIKYDGCADGYAREQAALLYGVFIEYLDRTRSDNSGKVISFEFKSPVKEDIESHQTKGKKRNDELPTTAFIRAILQLKIDDKAIEKATKQIYWNRQKNFGYSFIAAQKKELDAEAYKAMVIKNGYSSLAKKGHEIQQANILQKDAEDVEEDDNDYGGHKKGSASKRAAACNTGAGHGTSYEADNDDGEDNSHDVSDSGKAVAKKEMSYKDEQKQEALKVWSSNQKPVASAPLKSFGSNFVDNKEAMALALIVHSEDEDKADILYLKKDLPEVMKSIARQVCKAELKEIRTTKKKKKKKNWKGKKPKK